MIGDELFRSLVHVELRGSDITDEFAAENLAGLTTLNALSIESPHLTDAAMPHIASLHNVEFLILKCPRLTDAALPHISINADDVHSAERGVLVDLKKAQSLDEALDAILTPCRLGYVVDSETIKIVSLEEKRKRRQGATAFRAALPSLEKMDVDW